MSYRKLQLFIDGDWVDTDARASGRVINPGTGEEIGRVPFANRDDLDRALAAAQRAFRTWRKTSAVQRADILHKAAALIRERTEMIVRTISLEQGKPLAEARWELAVAADIFDWSAEEGRRVYGRTIPTRRERTWQTAVKEPIGPVAAFSPWNGPALLFGRKVAEALAAGCTCIIKPAEETPATALEITQALADAGLPAGVLNVVFGVPSEVSTHLIHSPVIRKVTFTGSVEVGRQLAKLAGANLKPITLELGGHGPVIICDDVDLQQVVGQALEAKFTLAGQVCVSPTRFLVHERIYDQFVKLFSERASSLNLGEGLQAGTQMGPLANERRLAAMERIVADAKMHGARIETGGKRRGERGFFFEPTVVTAVSMDSEIMNCEPFGPICIVKPFAVIEEAVAEANRLSYGLASYAFTQSLKRIEYLVDAFEAGLVGINTFAIADPETPFGGVKDSGYGVEAGFEGVSSYLVTKYVAVST